MHGAEAGPCCGRHRLRSHPRERSDSPAGLCPLCAGSSGCWLRGAAPASSAAARLGATLLSLQQHGNSQHESLPRPGQSCSVPSLASHLSATEYERSLLSVGQPLHLSQTPPRISGSILLQQLKSARICNQVSNFQYQSTHAETFGYRLVSLKNLLQRLRIWQEA